MGCGLGSLHGGFSTGYLGLLTMRWVGSRSEQHQKNLEEVHGFVTP